MQLVDLIKKHFFIVKFLVVGTVSFFLDYLMLLLSYHTLHLNLPISTSIGFMAGLIVNFTLNKFWTFKSRGNAKKTIRQGMLYGVLVIGNLILTNFIILAFSNIDIRPEISKPIATILIMGINFVAYKWVIFKDKDPIEDIDIY